MLPGQMGRASEREQERQGNGARERGRQGDREGEGDVSWEVRERGVSWEVIWNDRGEEKPVLSLSLCTDLRALVTHFKSRF